MNPYVKDVRPLDDYCLEVWFENGERRVFDVKPYIYRGIFVRLWLIFFLAATSFDVRSSVSMKPFVPFDS